MTGTEKRSAILDEVRACVCKDRQSQYGDAEDNFANIAVIVNVALGLTLDAKDVAIIMCCVKLARLRTSPEYRDNWVDLAGYACCGGGIVDKC
jgi:hypothetical protein